MLKNLTTIACILLTISISAQGKTRDEVLQLIAEDTCECIKNDPEAFTQAKSMQQKEVALGICLLKSFNKRKSESEETKNLGVGLDFEALGEEVGIKMVTTCGADFMAIFSDDQLDEIIDEGLNDQTPPPPAEKDVLSLSMTVSLETIHNDVISYIKFKDDFDKEQTFLIVDQFTGKELLKKRNVGKTFEVYYEKRNFYDLSEQTYTKKKVLKYIELKE
ncbi:hypothetical protein [Seonamhaeicola aphaedonensis]|uniref:Uncharacterized protein n=1 Tax=Seonamhaeicola aphaedonensis TaxID=1461338 RepID=A0A3D9HJ55_9FLAO|nr:hypothetical protein [Seonamhaeicola aphaedonensis]RED49527.1 hypothetical protein DFQ02_102301 [Seonamhaeicola aphaedonensis]